MHLPYLSHQCSKASPVLSDNPRSLFSPRKEAAVYTSRLPDIYRRAPEVRCRGQDAGKMSLHCHPDDVPVRSWFLPILPLPAQHSFDVQGKEIVVKGDMLAAALEKLPADKRDIILLSYFMEMTDREIARELDTAHQNVSKRRARILKLMRDYLEKEGFEWSQM